METVSAVDILRDYDKPISVKMRAKIADELEKLQTDNAALIGANLALQARASCNGSHDWKPYKFWRGHAAGVECQICGQVREL